MALQLTTVSVMLITGCCIGQQPTSSPHTATDEIFDLREIDDVLSPKVALQRTLIADRLASKAAPQNDKTTYLKAFLAAYSRPPLSPGALHPMKDDGTQNLENLSLPALADTQEALDNIILLIERSKFGDAFVPLVRDGDFDLKKQFPECTAVGTIRENGDEDWYCSGVLIGPRTVLSAGHCNDCTHVAFGANLADKKRREVIPVLRPLVPHPDYGKGSRTPDQIPHDLKILVLDHAPKGIQPRSLATKEIIEQSRNICVVGYGASYADGLTGRGLRLRADIPIKTHACRDPNEQETYGCYPDAELVGISLLGKDACPGDSGGPFYVKSGSSWLLGGTVSRRIRKDWQKPECDGDGTIYVRIDPYLPWIRETLIQE